MTESGIFLSENENKGNALLNEKTYKLNRYRLLINAGNGQAKKKRARIPARYVVVSFN
jgi:hypothetical protein